MKREINQAPKSISLEWNLVLTTATYRHHMALMNNLSLPSLLSLLHATMFDVLLMVHVFHL